MVILTKLNKKDFEKILEAYSVTGYVSHKHISAALDNTVYIVKTKNKKYILKVVEHNKKEFIEFELKIIDYLRTKKIPLAKNYKTKSNKNVLVYKGKNIVLQEFIDGVHPKKYNYPLLKDIAEKTGLLSKYLSKIKLEGKYHWNDHHFKPAESFSGEIEGINYRKEESELLSQMQAIDRKKLRRSFVHSDVRQLNMLVKNNELKAIIDWDDLHEEYLVFELAVVLIDPCLEQNRIRLDRLKLMTRYYQKIVKLNFEEKKALYYFIMRRVLGTIFWLNKQIRFHPDLRKSLKKSLVERIKIYNQVKKLSLEEFLKLIN